MHFEYVELKSEDGVALPSAFFAPPATGSSRAVDAVILAPGSYGNFYHNSLLGIAVPLAAAGYAAMTLSTRGHDLVFRDMRNQRYLGGAYERIDDCGKDFEAAINWLANAGYRRIALYGHSLSGTKASYYVAHQPSPAVVALINNGGPRWSRQAYEESEFAEAYRKNREQAASLVAANRGAELFEMTYPLGPIWITADGYLDKYGGERYNIATFAQNIRVPFLKLDTGQDTGSTLYSAKGVADDMMRLAPANPANKAVMIEEADHFFTQPGSLAKAAAIIVDWLNGLPAD